MGSEIGREPRPTRADRDSGARGQLATGGRRAFEDRGDLFELEVEDVVQEERGAFERRERLEGDEERHRDRFVYLVALLGGEVRGDEWFGKPRAHVRLASDSRGAEAV